MISVGRETGIQTKTFVCRKCAWEGAGPELATGLARVKDSAIYVYSFRCPHCSSFDITAKGKLLLFRSRVGSVTRDASEPADEDKLDALEGTREKTNHQ